MNRLPIVGKAIGPEGVRGELLSMIEAETSASPPRQEDEVLCALAQNLNVGFLQLMGGKEHLLRLIQILIPLARMTETTVRSRAVASLASLFSVAAVVNTDAAAADPVPEDKQPLEWTVVKDILLDLAGIEEKMLRASEASDRGDGGEKSEKAVGAAEVAEVKTPKKIADTWFPGKLSASRLFAPVYVATTPGMTAERRQILDYLSLLVEDDMPMVRVAAASALSDLEAVVDQDVIRVSIVPIMQIILDDKADSVRETVVSAVTQCIKVLANTSGESAQDADETPEVLSKMVELYQLASCDPSWRVRLATVTHIADALAPLTKHLKVAIIQCFAELLDDEEAEVRLASVKRTAAALEAADCPEFKELVVPTVLTGFREMLEEASNDDPTMEIRFPQLRSAQALMCMELASFDAIPHDMLVQVVHKMFGDPQLCISMLRKFSLLIKLKESDPAALSQICMDSLSLATHEDWRVRCAFTAQLSFVFEQIISVEQGGDQADKETVERAWTAFKRVIDLALWDQVAEARSHFVQCLPAIINYANKLGGDGYVKEIITMVVNQFSGKVETPDHPERKTTYLFKISSVQALQAVLTMTPAVAYFADESSVTELLDLLVKGAKDTTPNVRLASCRALGAFGTSCAKGEGAAAGRLSHGEMLVKPTLSEIFETDADYDVKEFAKVALDSMSAV